MKVLVVDDDELVREALVQTLELEEFDCIAVANFISAKDHIDSGFEGVILSDIRMPGKDGFHLLAYAQDIDPELPVILLTGEGDIPMAVRGVSEGAFDFLEKPCAPKDLTAVVEKAWRTRRLVLENRALRQQVEQGDAAARLLIGHSVLADQLRARARVVARAAAEVLICGEPGSGTSKVAEVVHLLSESSMRVFHKVSAAGLTTDALQAALTTADGGTLFLDEISALPPATQFSLLEHLESSKGTRVISGTYRDLAAEAEAGRFNADLYYRLSVLTVRIPSLKERAEDIPVLFRHYVAIAAEQAALPLPDITPEINARLMAEDWPGNARALMNEAMRFVMGLSEGGALGEAIGLTEQLARVEQSLLTDALQRCRGNATEAAALLKLPRKTFYDKLTRHGIRAERFRE